MAAIAAVVTASDSAAAGRTEDLSGPLAAQLLAERFGPAEVTVVPDDVTEIGAAIRELIDEGARVIVVTGGTGIGPRDVTPEAIRALGGREIPGIAEAIRAASRAVVPQSDLSRTMAVATSSAIILGVPGSPGGVRDALAVALPLLPHALAMLDGAGHGTHAPPTTPVAPSPIRQNPISVTECEAAVARGDAGAVVSFTGVVRDHDNGRGVAALSYEAHPDAASILQDVVHEARQLPGVLAACALHRVGDLEIGECAFVAAVSAAHRGEAFAACAWLVDEVKRRTPIWKHQRFSDGTSQWVNSP